MRRAIVLTLGWACTGDPAHQPATRLGVVPDVDLLAPTVLWMAEANPIEASTTLAVSRLALFASVVGTAGTKCPAPLAPTCLDLSAPAPLLGVQAVASPGPNLFALTPPLLGGPRLVWLQVAAPTISGAALSGVVQVTLLDPLGDEDGDGLLNREEVEVLGTRWDDTDTDDDGFSDDDEVTVYGSDPLVPDPATAIPEGMLMAWGHPDCPSGFEAWVPAEGRAVVAVADPAEVGLTVGARLTSQIPHAHAHGIHTTVDIPSTGVAGLASCCNNDPARAGTVDVWGTTDDGDLGLPLHVRQICRRTAPPRPTLQGDPVPPGLAAWFDADACPAGWASLPEADGRFVLGLPTGGVVGEALSSPLAPGEDRTHTHGITGSLSVAQSSLALLGGGTTYGRHGTFGVQAATSDAAGSGVPYAQALLCEKLDPALAPTGDADEDVPSGASLWSTAAACPVGFVVDDALHGRAMLGVPPEIGVGEDHGQALGPSQVAMHGHDWSTIVHVPHREVAAVTGCCFGATGAAIPSLAWGVAAPASAGLPTLALQACERL